MRRSWMMLSWWTFSGCVGALTSACSGGCGSTAGQSTPTAAVVAKDARPATLGSIDLQFEGGAAENNRPIHPGRVVGRGVSCEWGEGFSFNRDDVLGRSEDADWQFRIEPVESDPSKAEIVFVGRNGQAAVGGEDAAEAPNTVFRVALPWSDIAAEKRAGKRHRFTLDHTLKSDDDKRLAVKGSVTCPETGDLGDHGPEQLARLARLSSRTPTEQCGVDFGRERVPGCVSVLVPDDEQAETLVARIRADLGPGWVVYLGTTNFLGDEPNPGLVELVVAPGREIWDILVTAKTNAINYGLDTAGLILALQPLHAEVGFEILGAETDSLHVAMTRLPSDPKAFANKVYDLCPDIVDQGVGSVDELVREFTKSRQLHFWWD